MTTAIFVMRDRAGNPVPTQFTVNGDGSYSMNVVNTGGSGGGGTGVAETVWVDNTGGSPLFYVRVDSAGTISWYTLAGASASPTLANLTPVGYSAAGSGGATAANQATEIASLSTIATETTATATALGTVNTNLAQLHTDNTALETALAGVATATLQTAGNTSLSTIATNTTGLATAANQTAGNTSLSTIATQQTAASNALGTTADSVATSDTGTFSLIALFKKSLTYLDSLASNNGAGGTGISQPTGGSGVLGWLSGIYKTLTTGVSVVQGAQTATGTLTALNQTVLLTCPGAGSVGVSVEGTFSAQIELQGSNDGVNWVPVPAITQQSAPGWNPSAYINTVGSYIAPAGGFNYVQALCTYYGSGTANITMVGASANPFVYPVFGSAGGNIAIGSVNVRDGTGASINSVTTIDTQAALRVSAGSELNFLVDEFDATTINGQNWTVTSASGDIVRTDGNAAGASYLVISKDPLTANQSTTVTAQTSFKGNVEMIFGAHMSQRTWGQTLAIELVSNDNASTYTDVAISSIQQATTTLTVVTASAHNLQVGDSFAVYGVTTNSQMNYPELTVATVTNPTTFTATAGPQGTIPSLTVGPYTVGNVTKRRRTGRSNAGATMAFNNTTATNASFYTASDLENIVPSGTLAGNPAATVATSATLQAVSNPYSYSFKPSSEYHLVLTPDRVQWGDASIDGQAQLNQRFVSSQTVPINGKYYVPRFRAENSASLTVPVARIVSMSKTGTTTATVTTDVAHGLTTADLVCIYGSSDQTNYANLTAATAVASIVSSTQFTIVIGTSVTSTVYGGNVMRVNGGNLPSALGYSAVVANSATLATAADGTQALTLTGNTNWAGLLIGDYVNVHGLRSVPGAGSDLGCDGAWRVRNVSTTSLELGPIGNTSPPANFSATACGGTVIKRTDLRLSFMRVFSFDRLRSDMVPRPANDQLQAAPMVAQGGTIGSVSTVSTVSTVTSLSQIATKVPLVGSAANGSTNFPLGVSMATAVSQVDQSATAFAGSGSVLGTVVASAQGGGAVISAEINVSALTLGTATAVFLILQESRGGNNFTDIWTSDPITATGIQSMPAIPVAGRRRWRAFSVGGTSTTVTVTITTLELPPGSYPLMRQARDWYAATNPLASMFNSVALTASNFVLGTLSTATTPFYVEGTKVFTAFMLLAGSPTVTTQPVVGVQGSMDGVNWTTITGATMTAAGNGLYAVAVQNTTFKFARLIVTTAAAYSAGSYTISNIGVNGVN